MLKIFTLACLLVLPFGCDQQTQTEKKATSEAADSEDSAGVEERDKHDGKKKTKKAVAEEADKADKADKADEAEPEKKTFNSKVPTLDEWNAVTKEVAVAGSSERNCETKMVREWLRISCRGEGVAGTKIQSVKVLSGGNAAENFVYSKPDHVASLVMRFKPGTDLKALFIWTNNLGTLHVYWPRGAPEPQSKGKFTGP